MQTKKEPSYTLQHLIYLPAFAGYIYTHRLNDYVQQQINLSRKMKIPLLNFLSHLTEEQIFNLSVKTSSQFLNYLIQNKAEDEIEDGLANWKSNRLPEMDKTEIVAEDITLISYIRKQSFMHFVPDYCRNTDQMLGLINEIDLFCLESETRSSNLYINMLKERIEEHSHFIEKVNNTIPGAIYVFDIDQYKGIYSNNKLTDILGHDHNSLNYLKEKAVNELIHPEDREQTKKHLELLHKAKEGEILSYSYRIKDANGNYKWVRSYETVFRRHEDGRASQTIGITLDVENEKKTEEALMQRESQLQEAQDIAQMGSYYWDFENAISSVSPKTLEILEINGDNFESFLTRIHPEDLNKLQNEILKAKTTGQFECEYRLLGNKKEKIIWSRGIVNFKDGEAIGLHGTVMDITDRHVILQKLHESDFRYKQAEAFTHIGNYIWYIATNEIEWSEELFRIYELEPENVKLKYEFIQQFVHPDDANLSKKYIAEALDNNTRFDFHYRIFLKENRLKILHVRGEIILDDNKRPVKVLGTVQDVTEKQNLIQQLKDKEDLYKQAEELANMGNWTWEIQTNKIEWTDQLYKIYGLEPQSEVITNEKFISMVHPLDSEFVRNKIKELQHEDHLDFNFRIITKEGKVKTLKTIAQTLKNEKGNVIRIVGTERDITEKQNLIDQLKDSENHYKQAQALAHVGNWSWEVNSNIVKWSDELYNIYDLSPQSEIISYNRFLSFVHPEDREQVIKRIDQSSVSNESWQYTHRIITDDKNVKYILGTGEVITNNQGKAIMMVGTAQDITHQIKTQLELEENQRFIRKITDATPSIIASYNVFTGKYVFISEGLEKLLGFKTEEVLNKGVEFFSSLIHPDDFPNIMEKNGKVLQEANENIGHNDLVVEFTYRMRHKNGQYRWFHTYGTIFDRDKQGKVEHVLNISLDVTDQMEATEKIREQEHFIQQIADASPTILYLYDIPKQSVVYINREIFFVLGYLPEEIIEAGADITDKLYHPDDYHLLPGREQSKKNFQQIDSMIQYECRMKNKESDWRWLLVREIVFKTDENGNIIQILGAALDINRRKEMEKTILQNTMQLEQSNASLEEFAYVASHDLKEPLRKISTFGDRLMATHLENLTNDGKIYLKKIVDASQRMQTMISDLLSISMIKGNTSYELYSLQKILDETIQTFEFKIEQQNATIVSDHLPEAHIIISQFRQLFQNLLSNSLKFVREGINAEIRISHSYISGSEITNYKLNTSGKYLKIEFTDNGIGFENEYSGKIFAIFQRLHGRSEYEGSGIGLAICKKIVEHHGGIIYSSGIPDNGSTFTIILPV